MNWVWSTRNIMLKQLFFIEHLRREWAQDLTHRILHQLLRLHEDLADLKIPFTRQETDAVVHNMPSEKAPGPDGFNAAFLKSCWDIVAQDFYNLIEVLLTDDLAQLFHTPLSLQAYQQYTHLNALLLTKNYNIKGVHGDTVGDPINILQLRCISA